MEKLLELLNEYIDDGREWLFADKSIDGDDLSFFHTVDGEGELELEQVISKRFGFIKWLCDNKKIDLEELEKELS